MKKILPLNAIVLGLTVSMTLFGMVGCGEDAETTDSTETADETNTDGTTDGTTDDTTDDTTDGTEVSENWGAYCTADSDCGAPTDFCIKQPGASDGYCSIQCASNQVCYDAGADTATWTCNAVFSCLIASQTWCGPSTEIGQGPVIECE